MFGTKNSGESGWESAAIFGRCCYTDAGFGLFSGAGAAVKVIE